MGEEIKSTLQIALEKAEKLGKASKEELEWESHKEKALSYVGKFLRGEIPDFKEEITKFIAGLPVKFQRKALKTVVEGLIKNLVLPREEYHLKEMEKILEALKSLLYNIPQLDKLFEETKKLLKEYLLQKETIYQELEKRFAASLSALERAVSEEMGTKVKLSPEAHPQFQEEWRKIKDHLDNEYGRHLEYVKNILLKVVS
ncbi:MAG: DUF6657 family protein [Caldimicrobium sp.]|jgi:flagellar biosynthesis component FlhA|uniref:Uncharacterized protein n=1 Tax=Caldimicrobium thiodismutans TaxID=1653476 RepID=A0A2N7PK68_9BACT|nr:MAG: hypothetical protein C0197_02715 [Caldimicrobium thiodismutans]